jgi:N-acetylglutamate synthase-like GNAT family acetyltransferase
MASPSSREPSDSRPLRSVADDQSDAPAAKTNGAGRPRAAGERVCLSELPHGARIVAGNSGDHALVLQLLTHTQQAPLVEDFQSRLDEPHYRASDRLLVSRDQAIVGHVHVQNHTAWFQGQRMPVVKLEDFVALPEYRDAGYEEQLLQCAESIATAEGAVLAVVLAPRPEWFAGQGWSALRGQGHTRADVRAVLAHLDAQEWARRRRRRPAIQVRAWRHFELDQVRALYDAAATELWGPLYRSEACWRWIIGRQAQDQVLLAVVDRQSAVASDDDPYAHQQVVGYAVVRGSAIVEMMTHPQYAAARVHLLARACREAMDQDHHSMALYTAAADPLHELLVTAGGAWMSDAGNGSRWMVKLLAPERWVERAYPIWRARARAAGVPRPVEFGLSTGEEHFCFTLTRRSSRLVRTPEPMHEHVCAERPAIESLLVGNLSAAARGQLRLSHPEMAQTLAALFPANLFWQSPLEGMRL